MKIPNRLGITQAALGALMLVFGATGPALAADPAPAGDEEMLTIYSGIFTEEQAERGGAIYREQCSSCHGRTGRGTPQGPPITGAAMNSYDGVPLIGLTEMIRITMPVGRPGSLSSRQLADVTAYVLSLHGAPAGEEELPADDDAYVEIMITRPDN